MSLFFQTLADLSAQLEARKLSAVELMRSVAARTQAVEDRVLAFNSRDEADALAQAEASDRRRAAGEARGPLDGIPIGLKDVIAVAGQPLTASSKMLANFVSPYDATVTAKLKAAGAICWGRLNLDEFAMGSSTENSAVHTTRNPWDLERVPGGSSGGSAAAVAAGLCAAALGTDTGGSIRQPAAMCGVVGLKPTYGRVSRYGVVAYASSLDQVGPIARSVADAALLLEVIAGHDPRDATSLPAPVPAYVAGGDLAGLRVGLPREYYADGLDAEIRAALERTAAALRERGATVTDVSLPHTQHALPAYYLIAPAEASSNLARYDGIRYGTRAPDAHDLAELYSKTRGAGFGPEVKRRIMLGTYALRSGYYDAYYKKAQQVRAKIRADFDAAWETVDVLLTPTTPAPAFRFGSKATPLDMYLGDIYTLACNLAGIPGLSVPCGLTQAGLPIGAQLLGKPLDEATLLRAGAVIETAVGLGAQRPKAVS